MKRRGRRAGHHAQQLAGPAAALDADLHAGVPARPGTAGGPGQVTGLDPDPHGPAMAAA
jgi:hypothetical protein